MKVDFQPYTYHKLPSSNVSFGSLPYWSNSYTDVNGIVRSTQNTTEKRSDLNYKKLAAILGTRFKNYDKVNIMPMNTSDATELYYISEALVERCGFDIFKKKYTPIYATDVCSDIIERYPKRGIVYLREDEVNELTRILKSEDASKYRDISLGKSYCKPGFYKLFSVKDEYKELFEFGVCDFQERIRSLNDKGNSVAIIRNCFRQSFGDVESSSIIYKLSKKLNGASLLITGSYDREHMPFFTEALKANFEEIDRNVWQKRGYRNILKKCKHYLLKML